MRHLGRLAKLGKPSNLNHLSKLGNLGHLGRRSFLDQTSRKLKIQIASDLHIEHHDLKSREMFDKFIIPAAPFLALAGDIGVVGRKDNEGEAKKYRDFLFQAADKFERVFVVAGNHELYGSSRNVTDEKIHKICSARSNLTFLQRTSYSFPTFSQHSVKIIGATLWTNIPLWAQYEVGKRVGDYRRIYSDQKTVVGEVVTITPREVTGWHKKDLAYIEVELKDSDERKESCLVVTHHAPLVKETANPKYANEIGEIANVGERSATSTAFSSALNHLFDIESLKRGGWVFGHTHFSVDKTFPEAHRSSLSPLSPPSSPSARLVSNQFGYGREANNFKKSFVIEMW